MFNNNIQNRVNLSILEPALLEGGPAAWDTTLYELSTTVDFFWSLYEDFQVSYNPISIADTDELVAVIMLYSISNHFDEYDAGVLEVGGEYHRQSGKVNYLLGTYVRHQLRAMRHPQGTRKSIYPSHLTSLDEIFTRAKRAASIMSYTDSRNELIMGELEGFLSKTSQLWQTIKAMSDDELVDCLLISYQLDRLSNRRSGLGSLAEESFTPEQFKMGAWFRVLGNEYRSRTN